MQETVSYKIIFGTVPGYFVDNKQKQDIEYVSKLIQELATQVYEKTNIYLSSILTEGRAIYNQEWGCPAGGEHIYILNITINPEFVDVNEEEVENSILFFLEMLKKELNQETMSIEKSKLQYKYLKK